MIRAIALWLALVTPSLLIVSRTGGTTGAALYLLGAGAAVWGFTRWQNWPPSRRVPVLAAATTVAIVALFLVVYPKVNSQQPGSGSDDDDAYNIGVIALAHGESPYSHTTYLGNPLAPMAGAYVLAAPFVALGTSAWQNIFWLVVFFVAIGLWPEASGAADDDPRSRAMRLAWLVCLASGDTMQNIVTGTAHVANTIYAALGLWWLTRTSRPTLVAALWGLALASRANFLALVPLAAGALVRRRGWRTATAAIGSALAVTALLTVPFYVHDPAAFAPLYSSRKLAPFDQIVPHASAVIVAVMGLVALWGSVTRLDGARLFWKAAAVQAVPIVAGLAIGVWSSGALDVAWASYATFAAWFVLLAISRRPASLSCPCTSRRS